METHFQKLFHGGPGNVKGGMGDVGWTRIQPHNATVAEGATTETLVANQVNPAIAPIANHSFTKTANLEMLQTPYKVTNGVFQYPAAVNTIAAGANENTANVANGTPAIITPAILAGITGG